MANLERQTGGAIPRLQPQQSEIIEYECPPRAITKIPASIRTRHCRQKIY